MAPAATASTCLGERGGADLAAVAELEEQPVAARRSGTRPRTDRPGPAGLALGMGVEEGLVVLAQGDQMPVGAEVGLDRVRRSRPSRLTVKLDRARAAARGAAESIVTS